MSILDAALAYAARGLPVFPVFGVTSYRDRFICLCGKGLMCARPGKHPMGRYAPNGLKDASTDVKKIRWWWECAPDANVAIAGSIECCMFDVDPRHGGDITLEQRQAKHGALPVTWTAKTGSGGSHYYFRPPHEVRNSEGLIGAGLDIRGVGGYVVAPPSRHESGKHYAWLPGRSPSDVPLAPMPEWLLAAARSQGDGKAVATPSDTWRDLVRSGVIEGARNKSIARLAGHFLRRYVDPIVTLEMMVVWNAARCRPPLGEDEVETIVGSIAGREIKHRGG